MKHEVLVVYRYIMSRGWIVCTACNKWNGSEHCSSGSDFLLNLIGEKYDSISVWLCPQLAEFKVWITGGVIIRCKNQISSSWESKIPQHIVLLVAATQWTHTAILPVAVSSIYTAVEVLTIVIKRMGLALFKCILPAVSALTFAAPGAFALKKYLQAEGFLYMFTMVFQIVGTPFFTFSTAWLRVNNV